MAVPTPSRRSVLAAGSAAALAGAASPRAVAAHDRARHWVDATLARMTLEQKVGQLFTQHVYGSSADAPDARNVPLYGVASPAEVVRKYHLGGVIYFAWTDSVKNPEQIAALSNGLQRAALQGGRGVPLQISTDQEQGVVTRVGPPATQFPGSMALGAGRSPVDALKAAAVTGAELRALGVNTDFAPVADVNVNALNPVIGVRSFGSRPDLVATLVAAQVTGYQRLGAVAASAKHFPGHGDTATDSHVAFPVITHTREQWDRLDAPPFRAAVAAGIDMVMTAHLSFPALDPSGDPATLSRAVVTGLLREQLGFRGVVVTDSLAMQGVRDRYGDAEVAVRALEAGVDILLMTPAMDAAYAAVLAAVRAGRLSERDIDAKVRRILELKRRRGIVARPYVDPARIPSVVGTPGHLAIAAAVADRTPTLVVNDDAILPLTPAGTSVLVTGYGVTTTATLARELAARGATCTALATGTSPDDATIAAAVAAAARDRDLVVVTTAKAWDTTVTDRRGGQRKLVKAVQDTGVAVVVVAVRDPYDIAHLPGTRTYVATYAWNDVAIGALVRMLTGEVTPTGRLPVDIPTAADPAVILYPYGHGLTS